MRAESAASDGRAHIPARVSEMQPPETTNVTGCSPMASCVVPALQLVKLPNANTVRTPLFEKRCARDSKRAALRRLITEEERLGVLPLAAQLERSKVLEPRTVRCVGAGLPPQLQCVEVLRRDFALTNTLEQVVAESRGKIRPLDLRHQSPNVSRASSDFNCSCSRGSFDRTKRSAISWNLFFSASFASRPASTRSTSTRFALLRHAFARLRTRRAVFRGRLTLCRTGFSFCDIEPTYTTLHHSATSSCARARDAVSTRRRAQIGCSQLTTWGVIRASIATSMGCTPHRAREV